MSPGSNRLAAETSPYLLQHAHNPVDWYPWGPEALAQAVSADRPIFLSIGYAACHWCHVMERESFEDEQTAAILNAAFVSIKVDREERPDLDAVYMAALQSMTGGGGWPMSLFLTPDGRPFYGGTYFPSQARGGLPSFRQILAAVSRSWEERRADLDAAADQVTTAVRRGTAGLADSSTGMPEPRGLTHASSRGGVEGEGPLAGALQAEQSRRTSLVAAVVERLVAGFDFEHGGWAGPPRFPQPAIVDLLLRRARAGSDDRALRAAARALDVMAAGGIHDQLGGGFHRYATDTNWLVPHFEKMLYDNAQLARVYLHAYQLTGERRFRDVAETTLDYMASTLRTPEGLFAASEDADTDGVEGGTYVWTCDQVADALEGTAAGPESRTPAGQADLTELFGSAYGVTDAGNWEGRTILSRVMSDEQIAERYGLRPEAVGRQLELARRRLLERRGTRPQPARDDKAVTAWNGLTLAAFAEAIPVLDRPGDRIVAEALADSALGLLRGPNGRLARSFRSGRTAGTGGLEDYACLADGFLSLYEATFAEPRLAAAGELVDYLNRQFADPAGGWFDTASDAERLIVRPKEMQDGATPAGGSMAACVTLRLAELTGDGRLRDAAERAIGHVEPLAVRYPRAFAVWLGAIDFASAPVAQVAIVGDPEAADTRALVDTARRGFQPHLVLAVGDPTSSALDLLRGRFAIDGRATAFVCRGFTCGLPVTEPEALTAELA
jgi:uncharacterized protein YyaL (SSP411 family)